MEKEKLLERARKDNIDEGLEFAKLKGWSLSSKILSAIFIVIIITDMITGQTSAAVLSLFLGFLSGQYYELYKFRGEKLYLFSTVGLLIASLLYLVAYLISVFK